MLRSSLFFQIAQFEFFGFFADLNFWFINESLSWFSFFKQALFFGFESIDCQSVGLTNGSRGIANAWRLWCKIEVQR